MTKRVTETESKAISSDRITPSYRPRQAQKSAPCQVGCANCGDIRGWIGTVAQRRKIGITRKEAYARAWRVIAEVNPFPATLGRICPHPCESQCNRADLDEPLAINAMERFLGDHAIQAGLPLPRKDNRETLESVGVVGAGPSGLSFAYQMARRGYAVTVYDEREEAGGMLRYGVPDYRLPQGVLDAEVRKILELGVELELNTSVGKDISLETLEKRHDFLYLGIGAQKGRGLRIPGVHGPSVMNATEYLGCVNRGEDVSLGAKVIVVGGGNSAIDAARCARRGGAHVTILYRRSLREMPAIKNEIEDAVEEGVEIRLLVAPVRMVRSEDGRLIAVDVQAMQLAEPDSSGRCRPVPVEGSVFSLEADAVIVAISQVPELNGFEIFAEDGGWLLTDRSGFVRKNLWAGGDAVGLGIAGEAIVQGRHAAEDLHAQLMGDPSSSREPEVVPMGPENLLFESKPGCGAVHPAKLVGQERVTKGMAEVAETISEERFLSEVERCFSCGSCFGCEQCYMYCTSGCFVRVDEAGPGKYFSLNLEACQECGKCIEVCPCGFLEAR